MIEPETQPHSLTIGVFDSGFGGLTVLRALLTRIPSARYLYLGDTARLPYGSKSPETVARYAVSATQFLIEHGADLLVIACNTATALALPEIRAASAPIPVFGVVQPGAEAALAASTPLPITPVHDPAQAARDPSSNPAKVIVLATAATVHSHAYRHALHQLGLAATEKACPLLVPLVEEGWLQAAPSPRTAETPTSPAPNADLRREAVTPREAVTLEVLHIYLTEALAAAPHAQTLLLGCTHYPLLRPEIAQTLATLNRPLHIIDSAEATADAVAVHLGPTPASAAPTRTFYATDSVEKFQSLGPHFLGQPLPEVHLIHLAE